MTRARGIPENALNASRSPGEMNPPIGIAPHRTRSHHPAMARSRSSAPALRLTTTGNSKG